MSKQYEQTIADRLLSMPAAAPPDPHVLTAQKMLQMNAVQRYRFDLSVFEQAERLTHHRSFEEVVAQWFRLPCVSMWLEVERFRIVDPRRRIDQMLKGTPAYNALLGARDYTSFLLTSASNDERSAHMFVFDYSTRHHEIEFRSESDVSSHPARYESPSLIGFESFNDTTNKRLVQSLIVMLTAPKMTVLRDDAPPPRLQAARRKRGQLPFLSYTTVTLDLGSAKIIRPKRPAEDDLDHQSHGRRRRYHPVDAHPRLKIRTTHHAGNGCLIIIAATERSER